MCRRCPMGTAALSLSRRWPGLATRLRMVAGADTEPAAQHAHGLECWLHVRGSTRTPYNQICPGSSSLHQTGGLTSRKLIRNWRAEVVSEAPESIDAL
jgi:hypothetical protein